MAKVLLLAIIYYFCITNLEGGVKSPGRPIIALPPPKDDRDIFPSVCGSVRPGRRFT